MIKGIHCGKRPVPAEEEKGEMKKVALDEDKESSLIHRSAVPNLPRSS